MFEQCGLTKSWMQTMGVGQTPLRVCGWSPGVLWSTVC